MFAAETTLQEGRWLKSARGHGSDVHRRKASCRSGVRGSTGECANGKAGHERLVCGSDRIERTVGNSRRYGCAPNCAKETALKCLNVGGICTYNISDGSRQDVAEKSEAGAEHRVRLELPSDGSTRLENCEWSGRKNVPKPGANRGV